MGRLWITLRLWALRLVGTRCTGACCKDFVFCEVNFSPSDLERARLLNDGTVEEGGRKYIDIEQIAGTVEHIRTDDDGFHHYRCRNITARGDCAIYESRPQMCRSYPDGHLCTFRGCTWRAVAARSVIRKIGAQCRRLVLSHQSRVPSGCCAGEESA